MIVLYIGLYHPQKTHSISRKILTEYLTGLHVGKCSLTSRNVLCCNVLDHIFLEYQIINGHVLKLKHQHTYLGLIVNETMQWSPRINNLAVKASKVLNFIKRNLSDCSSKTKASACLSLVHPIMEYASCVWDPHEAVNIQALEKVQ